MCYVEIIYCGHREGLPLEDFRNSDCKDYNLYPCNERAKGDTTKLCFYSEEMNGDWKAGSIWDALWVDNLKYPPWPILDEGVGFCPNHLVGTKLPNIKRAGNDPVFRDLNGPGTPSPEHQEPPNGKVLKKREETDLLRFDVRFGRWESVPERSHDWVWRECLGWTIMYPDPK